MPAANPFIAGHNGGVGYAAVNPAPIAAQTDTGASTMQAAIGTGSLAAAHNCPLHMAALIIGALAVVFILRALGFRFAVDAGVGRG